MPSKKPDPQNPTDMLDRPIAVGDIVAWGTNYGQSAALAICRIEKIRFTKPAPPGNWRVTNVECHQDVATNYTLRLTPLATTGHVSFRHKVTGEYRYSIPPGDNPDDYRAKSVTVKLVKNIVKLEPWNG